MFLKKLPVESVWDLGHLRHGFLVGDEIFEMFGTWDIWDIHLKVVDGRSMFGTAIVCCQRR
jgi:hypothetical protein